MDAQHSAGPWLRRRWPVVLIVVIVLVAGGGITAYAVNRHDRPVAAPQVTPTPSPTPTPTPTPTATRTTAKATPRPTVRRTVKSAEGLGDSSHTAPLTGEPVKNPAVLNHPAVAIKISNVPESQPEINIDKADIVFDEPNGPAYTRLAAVFHSNLPQEVGPVRSIRPEDAELLGPLHPVFANTRAADWVLRYVDRYAQLDDLNTLKVSGTGAYSLLPHRIAPNHVVAHPNRLLQITKLKAPPRPYFDYAQTTSQLSVASGFFRAPTVAVPWGLGYVVRYRYNAKLQRYYRWQGWGKPHILSSGRQVSAKNVVVVEVNNHRAKLGPGTGAPVPVLDLISGKGTFFAVTDGRAVRGTWTKGQINQPFVFRLANGQPLRLAPGNTFVELPSPNAGVHIGS